MLGAQSVAAQSFSQLAVRHTQSTSATKYTPAPSWYLVEQHDTHPSCYLDPMEFLRRVLLLVTDVGFLLYWFLTLGHVLPPELLFRDYAEPTTAAWNLSFLPLDLAVSGTGLASVILARRCPASARVLLVVSLVATSISGLQAIAFWTIRRDFDLGWWAPNVFLLAWPLPFLAKLVWSGLGESAPAGSASLGRS